MNRDLQDQTSFVTTLGTPVGRVAAWSDGASIVAVDWCDDLTLGESDPVSLEAARQLAAYFADGLETFDLPLNPRGTLFQQAVYQEMLRIPFGETRTYGDLAAATGSIARAVGGACGSNPIPLIIPCHRVIAGGGALGGFSGRGGRQTKAYLLAHESPQGSLL